MKFTLKSKSYTVLNTKNETSQRLQTCLRPLKTFLPEMIQKNKQTSYLTGTQHVSCFLFDNLPNSLSLEQPRLFATFFNSSNGFSHDPALTNYSPETKVARNKFCFVLRLLMKQNWVSSHRKGKNHF